MESLNRGLNNNDRISMLLSKSVRFLCLGLH